MQTMREFDCSSRDLFSIISSVPSLQDKEVRALTERACNENWNPMPAQALTILLNSRRLTPEQAGLFVRNGLARKPSLQALTSLFRNKEERARFDVAANQEPDFQQAKNRKAQLAAAEERGRREFEEERRKAQLEEAHRKAQLEAECKAAAVEEERDRRKIEETDREMPIEIKRMESEMSRLLRESDRRAAMAYDEPPCVRLAGGVGRLGFWPSAGISLHAEDVSDLMLTLNVLRPATVKKMIKFQGKLLNIEESLLTSFQEYPEYFIQQALREMYPQLRETTELASEIQKSSSASLGSDMIDRIRELPKVIQGFVESCRVDEQPPPSPRGPGSSERR